jgi:hypothetical protein
MPIRIRWRSKDYIGYGLMLLGGCGLFQIFFILFAQYFLLVANYFIIIIIPIGTTLALFYASLIIFESFAEVRRRRKLRSQFRKVSKEAQVFKRFLAFPITLPLLITFIVFVILFIIAYLIFGTFLNNQLSFLISENVAAILLLLVANGFERYYAKIRRY